MNNLFSPVSVPGEVGNGGAGGDQISGQSLGASRLPISARFVRILSATLTANFISLIPPNKIMTKACHGGPYPFLSPLSFSPRACMKLSAVVWTTLHRVTLPWTYRKISQYN